MIKEKRAPSERDSKQAMTKRSRGPCPLCLSIDLHKPVFDDVDKTKKSIFL
jgi:hypothetical protein